MQHKEFSCWAINITKVQKKLKIMLAKYGFPKTVEIDISKIDYF